MISSLFSPSFHFRSLPSLESRQEDAPTLIVTTVKVKIGGLKKKSIFSKSQGFAFIYSRTFLKRKLRGKYVLVSTSLKERGRTYRTKEAR